MEISYPTLDLIIGAMFSGKSSELIRRLNIMNEMGLKTLYINSALDTRTSVDFSTHNPTLNTIGNIQSQKINDLNDIFKIVDQNQIQVIGIDEAQMFKDLKKISIALVEKYNKKVIVAGLNGDSFRNPFGEILDLIPYCDAITKLNPFCKFCCTQKSQIKDAPFTGRFLKSSDVILIGDSSIYSPVCRECYKRMNNTL